VPLRCPRRPKELTFRALLWAQTTAAMSHGRALSWKLGSTARFCCADSVHHFLVGVGIDAARRLFVAVQHTPKALTLLAHHGFCLRGLTFELTGPLRWDGLARAGKMYRVPQAGPRRPAVVGPVVQRGVRPHRVFPRRDPVLKLIYSDQTANSFPLGSVKWNLLPPGNEKMGWITAPPALCTFARVSSRRAL